MAFLEDELDWLETQEQWRYPIDEDEIDESVQRYYRWKAKVERQERMQRLRKIFRKRRSFARRFFLWYQPRR